MLKVGVVGASGFVGRRAVERLHDQGMTVCPIVRNPDNLASLTAQNLNPFVANAFDAKALTQAFQGCDIVIHSVLGSPGLMRGSVAPAYQAAQKAGVRRLIYLSSMIVHTSAPAPGTTESTPPIHKQPGFPTHIAKIDAERQLRRLRKKGSVEVVIFRPGIVFGPRSRWVADLAHQLAQGTAYLINAGRGVCNTVYIDNLIHALRLAMTAEGVDGEAFFVGDREDVTWFDFYRPYAEALGVDPTQIPQVAIPHFTHSRQQQVMDDIRHSVVLQKLLASIPDNFKQKFKRTVPKQNKSSTQPLPARVPPPQPVVTEMMAILQQSEYKLPFEKAQKILGYEPIVTFKQGCRHSIDWLKNEQPLLFSATPHNIDTL
ncbi:MAG: NAD(P)-dependent oxidoreductase [Acaryochloris sp. RU_4_1]|nr:NAD(P)-dependent oxidoreductase [Acaryochloris sp. RU_4_1]